MVRESPERLIKRVARRIVEVRRAAGITQERFAEAMDVTVQYVSRIEVGENITLSTLVKIANALGSTVIDLLEPPKTAEHPQKRGRGRPRKTGG